MNASNAGEGYFATHPSAHVGSAHFDRQSIVAVHAVSLMQALSSLLHAVFTHVVHGSPVASKPKTEVSSAPVSNGSRRESQVVVPLSKSVASSEGAVSLEPAASV